MRRYLERYAKDYYKDPNARTYALRHAGATVLERARVATVTIQRILGHENRSTTEIYLHSLGDAEREAMALYERNRKKVPQFPHNVM